MPKNLEIKRDKNGIPLEPEWMDQLERFSARDWDRIALVLTNDWQKIRFKRSTIDAILALNESLLLRGLSIRVRHRDSLREACKLAGVQFSERWWR